MGMSVNTNVGALAALKSLNTTNKGLSSVQSRINTGLAVSSTKDDSAKFTTAQKLRGELGGLTAVTSSLNNAKSVTDVAVSGAEQISDLLNQMKTKATEASDAGLTDESRGTIAKDYAALKEQIGTIIKSSSFNGTNLLADTATTGATSATVAALQSTDPADTLTVANQGFQTSVTGALGAITTAASAATEKAAVDAVIGTVNTTLSELGSKSRKIDGQLSFVSKLSDTIEGGIGNLVDADLAKESAKLQALQVKQQLGVQALSIANQAPQSIMSLFR